MWVLASWLLPVSVVGFSQSSTPKTLVELHNAVTSMNDHENMAFLVREVKETKADLLEMLNEKEVATPELAAVLEPLCLSAIRSLSAVSPLPSPAFAANLFTGRLTFCGRVAAPGGDASAELDDARDWITTLESGDAFDVEVGPTAGKPSKQGFGLKRGDFLWMRPMVSSGGARATVSPASPVVKLVCTGPISFDFALQFQSCASMVSVNESTPPSSPDFETAGCWSVLYLDQDFFVCATGTKTKKNQDGGGASPEFQEHALVWSRTPVNADSGNQKHLSVPIV